MVITLQACRVISGVACDAGNMKRLPGCRDHRYYFSRGNVHEDLVMMFGGLHVRRRLCLCERTVESGQVGFLSTMARARPLRGTLYVSRAVMSFERADPAVYPSGALFVYPSTRQAYVCVVYTCVDKNKVNRSELILFRSLPTPRHPYRSNRCQNYPAEICREHVAGGWRRESFPALTPGFEDRFLLGGNSVGRSAGIFGGIFGGIFLPAGSSSTLPSSSPLPLSNVGPNGNCAIPAEPFPSCVAPSRLDGCGCVDTDSCKYGVASPRGEDAIGSTGVSRMDDADEKPLKREVLAGNIGNTFDGTKTLDTPDQVSVSQDNDTAERRPTSPIKESSSGHQAKFDPTNTGRISVLTGCTLSDCSKKKRAPSGHQAKFDPTNPNQMSSLTGCTLSDVATKKRAPHGHQAKFDPHNKDHMSLLTGCTLSDFAAFRESSALPILPSGQSSNNIDDQRALGHASDVDAINCSRLTHVDPAQAETLFYAYGHCLLAGSGVLPSSETKSGLGFGKGSEEGGSGGIRQGGPARGLWKEGRRWRRKLYRSALEVFDEGLRRFPRSVRLLYGASLATQVCERGVFVRPSWIGRAVSKRLPQWTKFRENRRRLTLSALRLGVCLVQGELDRILLISCTISPFNPL